VASYLARHNDIFMSPLKEPKFISSHFLTFPLNGPGDGFIESFTIKKFDVYKKLYRKANGQAAIGEASVENLYYYRRAIPLIKRYFGNPKIVIILRNPVDRSFSAYKQMVRDNRENHSFETGLQQEKVRMTSNWEYLWYYRDVGYYSRQVRAYLDSFSSVKIMLFDDLRNDTERFMADLLQFLGVDTAIDPGTRPRLNASGFIKDSFLRIVFRATRLKGMLYKFLTLSGIPDHKILAAVESVRHRSIRPIHMNLDTRRRLAGAYADDIDKTQKLIQRNLSHWKN
jgi:hypothetical protein